MQKYLLLSCLCVISVIQVLASGDPFPVGARALGVANASVTLADGWSLFNNPGGIAGIKQTYVVFAYDNRYGMPGMQSIATGLIYPSAYGSFGFSIHRFGDDLYSEHLLGVAYSHKISRVQLGIKANYVQIHAENLGSRGRLALEFGGIAEILPQLSFGAHIYNFNQAKLAEYQDERIPTIMKAGISYKPFPKLLMVIETEKDVDFKANIKTGLEYEIVKNLQLRTGISSNPAVTHFGIGFKPRNFQFDYALRTHPNLGISHHISLAFRFEKKSA
jgi:hypothetical protein